MPTYVFRYKRPKQHYPRGEFHLSWDYEQYVFDAADDAEALECAERYRKICGTNVGGRFEAIAVSLHKRCELPVELYDSAPSDLPDPTPAEEDRGGYVGLHRS